jgi:Spy/CpxP family protein refolding chaperone
LASIKADTTLTFDEKTSKIKQLHKDTIKSVVSVLTPDQRAKLAQLRAEAKAAAHGANPTAPPAPAP